MTPLQWFALWAVVTVMAGLGFWALCRSCAYGWAMADAEDADPTITQADVDAVAGDFETVRRDFEAVVRGLGLRVPSPDGGEADDAE